MKAHKEQPYFCWPWPVQIKMRPPFYWVQRSLSVRLQTRILLVFALEIKFSRQITTCSRQLFPPKRFCVTRCFLQVSDSPLSPLQLWDLAQPPTRSGQSICSTPAVPTYSSLLAQPYGDLSITPCAYTEVWYSVQAHLLHQRVEQVLPTRFVLLPMNWWCYPIELIL